MDDQGEKYRGASEPRGVGYPSPLDRHFQQSAGQDAEMTIEQEAEELIMFAIREYRMASAH